MAQSMRRLETLGAVDRDAKRDKSRNSYFGNVKSRSEIQIRGLLRSKTKEKAPKQTCDTFGWHLFLGFEHVTIHPFIRR